MNLLNQLQIRTLPRWQLLGFALTLFIGLFIIGLTVQVYLDIQQVFEQEKAVFGKQGIVVNKRISVFKSFDKERIYFDADELADLEARPFVEELAYFDKARFGIQAFTREGDNIPGFRTDMFFEAIPDGFLDVEDEDWKWQPGDELVPIIIPQDYINLYNFGFAETQGLPVVSQNAIKQVEFGLRVSGNGAKEEFRGRIVAFSEQINSILVPLDFLDYANGKYASGGSTKPSRLLIRLNDPSSEEALTYFDEENLDVSNNNMEQSRMRFFLNVIFLVLFVIAGIIIVLSISSILLSMNVLLYKNKATINNLYLLGYENKQIGRFYYLSTAVLILLSGLLSILCIGYIHGQLDERIGTYFDLGDTPIYLVLVASLCLLLLVMYKVVLSRRLQRLNSQIV